MNGFSRAPRRKPAFRLLGLGMTAIGLGLLSPGLIEGSPIRRAHDASAAHEDSMAHPGVFRTWPEYLTGGPSVWSTHVHPPLTLDVRLAIWHAIKTDPGDTSPWIQFLLYKQSLDEARFDHFHPRISKALAKLPAPHTVGPVVNPLPSTTPSSGPSTPPNESQQIQPQAVPEPGAWLVAMGMAGWGLWWRRRAR
jgi:hypothetical protein